MQFAPIAQEIVQSCNGEQELYRGRGDCELPSSPEEDAPPTALVGRNDVELRRSTGNLEHRFGKHQAHEATAVEHSGVR